MVDRISKKKRSELMGKIPQKDTKPEIAVRHLVWKAGFRYRLHRKDLPGTPDIVFPRLKKVIFVNGCFWHGHKCRAKRLPKTRVAFWASKIARNKRRDKANQRRLHRAGWRYMIAWECELKKPNVERNIFKFLNN